MYFSILHRENRRIWQLLQKQPHSWLQTLQLIPCWLPKLCSLMVFEGPCTTLIIQNFKWPTAFCFFQTAKAAQLVWELRWWLELFKNELCINWIFHILFPKRCCLLCRGNKVTQLKCHTHKRTHSLFSSCVSLIGLLEQCLKCSQVHFPLYTDLATNFKLNWNCFLLTEQQNSLLRRQLCLSYLEFKYQPETDSYKVIENAIKKSRHYRATEKMESKS